MSGRIGFIRERGGRIERMTLVGGTELAKDDARLTGDGVLAGAIVRVLRRAAGDAVDGLAVDADLPSGDALAGLTAVVHDGVGFTMGHEIVEVRKQDGATLLVLADDPGFEMTDDGASRHTYFPGRSWDGENRVEIATVKTTFPSAD